LPTTFDLLTAADRLMVDAADLDPADFDAALLAWLGDSADKAERIAALRVAALAKAEMHKAQAEAHTAARKRHEATCDRCTALMVALLTTRRELGEDAKIPGVARLQRNGGKAPVVIADPAAVPLAFCVVPPPVPDRERIRAALADGVEVPGAMLGEVGESVRWDR